MQKHNDTCTSQIFTFDEYPMSHWLLLTSFDFRVNGKNKIQIEIRTKPNFRLIQNNVSLFHSHG